MVSRNVLRYSITSHLRTLVGILHVIVVAIIICQRRSDEKAVVEKKLPETVGFFFGNCTKDNEEYRELDLQFIKKARRCLENGWQVEYTSWW